MDLAWARRGVHRTVGLGLASRTYFAGFLAGAAVPTTRALSTTMASTGTFWWKPRLAVGSLAILSTTSMPFTTLPNTA